MYRSQTQGQSAVLFAVILPFLVALLMTAIEVHERYLERALIEDALQQATRSAAQRFDYRRFAAAELAFSAEPGGPTLQGCANAPAASTRAIACSVLIANLRGVRGLQETPEQTAERVTWMIHQYGGTCTFPGDRQPYTSPEPMVCASLRPQMTGFGLLGSGVWEPQIDAIDVLDRAR